MPAFRYVYDRWIPRAPDAVRSALDGLWTGRADDAFPHDRITGWRRPVDGAADTRRFTVGTRFGHGPFAFVVDRADERNLRARITTQGYDGWHGFELVEESRDAVRGTRVSHELVATTSWGNWLAWMAAIGKIYDWAVLAMLLRLDRLVTSGATGASPAPPWQLTAFAYALRGARGRRPRPA